MTEDQLLEKALRFKMFILGMGVLISLIGIIAAGYLGDAIQFRDGGFKFGEFNLTFGSGGTLLVFLCLAAWVFYRGSSLELELTHPNPNQPQNYKIRIRRIKKG